VEGREFGARKEVMSNHSENGSHVYAVGAFSPLLNPARSSQPTTASLQDEAGRQMTDEGCPNDVVATVPDSTGYSGDPGALRITTVPPGNK